MNNRIVSFQSLTTSNLIIIGTVRDTILVGGSTMYLVVEHNGKSTTHIVKPQDIRSIS